MKYEQYAYLNEVVEGRWDIQPNHSILFTAKIHSVTSWMLFYFVIAITTRTDIGKMAVCFALHHRGMQKDASFKRLIVEYVDNAYNASTHGL